MNNKGFTLIEIIITIAILSIVIVPLSSMFIQAAKMNSMAAEEYDATLIAQKYFEEIKAIDNDIDASLLNYSYNANEDTFSKNIVDGEFSISILLTAVAGTENLNSENSEESLSHGNNMIITFNSDNTIMTVVSSKDSITDTNSGVSQNVNISNISSLKYEFVLDGSNMLIQGSAVQSPATIITTDYTQYNIAIILNKDLNLDIYNKMISTPVKITAIKNNSSGHVLNLKVKEGNVEEKVNVIQGNVGKLSNSILYDVTIIINRNGNEVDRFVGKKVFAN